MIVVADPRYKREIYHDHGLSRCACMSSPVPNGGAQSLGVTHLRATASDVWLGRHTETLTDAPAPIRYFALGCLVPAARGGETLLFDGRKAARLLAESLHGAREVRIRYRSKYRPEVADHSLIIEDERRGPVLRFRSATENNEIITKPVDINEPDLYAAVEDAVSRSLALIHSWRAGEAAPRGQSHDAAFACAVRGPATHAAVPLR
jgi:hypothetical protein